MQGKVLIVTIPKQDVTRPPGILSILAGCCEQANYDYKCVDLNLCMFKTLGANDVKKLNLDFEINEWTSPHNQQQYNSICAHLISVIDSYQPSHVAISVFTIQSILAAQSLIQYLNDHTNRQYKIVIGGLGAASRAKRISGNLDFGQYILARGLIDYCIYGEGDVAFVELLQGNFSYPGINQNNSVQITDLDSVSVPSYKKINPSEYLYSDAPEVLVTGSRGCVRDCSFCDVGSYWKKFVYKSGQRMADELYKIYQDTGVQKFDFSDSLINGSLKTFREFNRSLIQYQNHDPNFRPKYKGQFICRPIGQLKTEDYEEMAKAGAETIVVGIEHFSESVRLHMKKNFDNAAIDHHFSECARLGIKNVLLLMSGYLTETAEDHAMNIQYLQRYQMYALSRVIYAINIEALGLSLFEGTPLYRDRDQYEIEFLSDEDKEINWYSLQNPELTPRERVRRALEIMYTANQLGYKILNLSNKILLAERWLQRHPVKKYLHIKSTAEHN